MAPINDIQKIKNIIESETSTSTTVAVAPVKFTSNETIDAIENKDNTIEISGYVDAFELPKIVGKQRKYNIIKFVLNNGSGKRVQCLAWQEQVERVSKLIEMNKIIRLNGAVSKEIANPAYNSGNIPFELTVQQHTDIDASRGYFGKNTIENTKPEVINWQNLIDNEGKLIEISGFIKMVFNMTTHKNGESAYALGAITNGKFKIAVRVSNLQNLPNSIRKGSKVSVIGILQFDGNPFINVANGSGIRTIEGTPLTQDEMLDVVSIPFKKAK